MTALEMLRLADVKAGQRVLVHGASGAIGTVAVQVAREMRCEVIGVCSTSNVELVHSFGATRVIDYKRESVREAGPVDAIIDASGIASDDALAVLKPSGAFVTAVFAFGTVFRLRRRGRRAFAAMVKPGTQALDELRALIERGVVRVPIAQVFALAEAGRAQAYLENNHPRGRIVLRVAAAAPE